MAEQAIQVIIPGQPVRENDPRQRSAATAVAASRGYAGNQPLATRHLDPNYNPELQAEVGQPIELVKIKVRQGYAFVMGEEPFRKSHPGPCIMWVTPDELKGQEWKVEVIGRRGASAQQAAAARPVMAPEELTFEKRHERIEQLRAELEILEADEAEDIEARQAAQAERAASNSEDRPPVNPNIVNLGQAPEGVVRLPAGMRLHEGNIPVATSQHAPRPAGKTSGAPAAANPPPAVVAPQPEPGSLDEELADDLEAQVSEEGASAAHGADTAPHNPNVAEAEVPKHPDQVGEEAGVPIIQPTRRRPARKGKGK